MLKGHTITFKKVIDSIANDAAGAEKNLPYENRW
jgi:hypothetical protein